VISQQDIEEYFTYHAPKPDQIERYAKIREAAKEFATVLVAMTAPSADQTHTIRLLRQVVMSANQTIALEEYEASKQYKQNIR
jgi:hypothetical protein